MKLSKETISLLDDIERRIDPATEEDYYRQWEDFHYGRFDGDIFRPERKKQAPSALELDHINISDAVEDYDLMLRKEFMDVSRVLNAPRGNLIVRANYGTGILSSLFGAEIYTMAREFDTLPTTRPFNDTERMRQLAQDGVPNLKNGFGERVFAFGEMLAEVLEKYPKIKKYVSVYHPDTQGPLDICELMWGCDIFYAMYDEPELVHAALQTVTDTYTAFLNKWFEMYPCDAHLNPHWGMLWHRGRIYLRCDSAMNLSPELYKEFAMPYDAQLLERFDGGGMHFCGRGDHYIEHLCNIPKLYAVQLSQPHLNDMEVIFRNTVDKGIPLMGYPIAALTERKGGYNHLLALS